MTKTTKKKATLVVLAKKINHLTKNISICAVDPGSSRMEIGALLLKAKNEFFRHNDGRFIKWCYENIHKADGKPFSNVTLYNYMKYAKNPELMKKEIERQRLYSQTRCQAIKFLSGGNPINGANHSEQVNRLVYAWDHASTEAREQFMSIVRLKDAA